MKIIIREYVENLGDKGDIVTVADGYARNYLIPRKFAVRATESELKQLAHRQKFADRREERVEKKLVAQVDTIKSTEIELEVHASSEGKLYGSIIARHIADALTEKLGIDIDRKRILLESPIKRLGEYQVTVKLGVGSKVDVKVTVVSGGGPVSEEDTEREEKSEAPVEKQAEAEKAEETADETAEVEVVAEEAEATEEATEEETATDAVEESGDDKDEEPSETEAPADDESDEKAEDKTEDKTE